MRTRYGSYSDQYRENRHLETLSQTIFGKSAIVALCYIIAQLAKLFQEMVNSLLFKVAQITYLIKNFGLEPGETARYKSISNLNLIV